MVGCVPAVKPDFCAPWRPIYVSANDVLTDSTAKQIKDHDETGVKLKCWKVPSKSPGKPL